MITTACILYHQCVTPEQRAIIFTQHKQIIRSLETNADINAPRGVDSIILAGLGGSGHPGDLLNALGLPKVPLFVHRNYNLPLKYLLHLGLTKPLVVTSSYSGNTEETLTAYQQALENNLPLLVSAGGGTLEEWARRDGNPFCRIDFPGMQPRHTLFAAFTGIYTALKNAGLAEDITADLTHVAALLKTATPMLEEPGKKLAAAIQGKTPIFISTDNLGFAAKNCKIQTNENAKYPAFWNTFPELNHNEMVGFSQLQKTGQADRFIAVCLKDPNDHPRNQARMQVTADHYRQWGLPSAEYTAQGDTLLEKLFTTITLGLWTTFYLAELNGIDPIPVEGVEGFKKKLVEVAGIIS